MPYTNKVGTSVYNNKSSFINCTFTVDDNYNDNYPGQPYIFDTHISMWQVNGLGIQGCTFQNNRSVANIPTDAASGSGIKTLDANFNVDDYCTDYNSRTFGTACPSTSIVHSTFNNLYTGIDANDVESSYNYTVKHAVFNNCVYGVYTSNVSNFNLTGNTFNNVGGNTTPHPSSIFFASAGIQNNGGCPFTITQNTFNAATALTQDAIGTYTVSSGGGDAEVYQNTYNNMTYANVSNGVNNRATTYMYWTFWTGLRYICNTYNNTTKTDELITTGITGFNPDDGIALYQRDFLHSNAAAGNCFSHTGYTWGDIYTGAPKSFNYYYNGSGCYTPTYYSTGVTPVSGAANDCPSIVPPSNFVFNTGVSYSNFNVAMQAAINNYFNAVDQGTSDMYHNEINNATSANTQQLYNDLTALSPWLSQSNLNLLISRGTGIMPNASLYNILAQNPDDLQDNTIWTTLATKPDPLTSDLITALQYIAQNNTTARTTMNMQIINLYNGMQQSIDTSIHHFLQDSIWYSDSILALTALKQTLQGDFESAKLTWAKGNYSSALNMIEALPTNYNLQNSQLADYNQLTSVYSLISGWHGANKNIMQLTNDDVANVYTIGQSGYNNAAAISDAILNFKYGYNLRIPLVLPTGPGFKNDKGKFTALTENPNKSLIAYPNPSNYFVTIKWNLPPLLAHTRLSINSIDGKEIYTSIISMVNSEIAVNTSAWPNGLYLISVTNDKGRVSTEKLAIAH